MIGLRFGKGQGFAHETADTLTKRTIPTFLMSRLTSFLANKMMRALREDGLEAPIVVEAAVLLEAGWQWLVDEIWVVTVTPEIAIARILASRQLDRADVERRIASQLSDAQRTREATCVISNDGTRGELRAAIERCWRERLVATA